MAFFVEGYVVLVENADLLLKFSSQDFNSFFSLEEFAVFFILFLIITFALSNKERRDKLFNFIYAYRLPISIIVIIVAVIFQIHGSSISEYNIFGFNHKPLLGVSRFIRSDEYSVNTMLAFSQYMNNFAYFSDIVRAATTDMFIIYGQPVLDIGMIFRPFLVGYLFLNQGQGLSFFWMARFVFLFLVSFEFGMLLTNKNKILSCAYAFLITFAPVVQWWYAVNGLVELLVFGQLGILLINWYMTIEDYKKRALIAIGLMISFGTFILVFYPSWQIPYAYVFALLTIWIFLKNWHNFTYNKQDLIIFAVVLIIFSIVMAHVLSNSWETIKIIFNTSYPGSQVFNGGGSWNVFAYYIPSIFYPLKQSALSINVCNYSVYMDLFPMPLIISAIVLFYQKTRDKLLTGLIALYFVLLIFYLITLPDFMINLTLRGTIKTTRLPSVITFVGVLILIRSMSSLKDMDEKIVLLIVSAVFSLVMVYWSNFEFTEYYLYGMPILAVIFYMAIFFVTLQASSKKAQKIFLISVICMSLLTGALVNPVDYGTDVVFESDHYKHVEEIVEKDPDALWLVDDTLIQVNSIFTCAGAKTINSIHVYPNLELWQKFDENNQSYDVYNRYAHIDFSLRENTPSNFKLVHTDKIEVNVNPADLEKLNVTYIESEYELDKHSNEHEKFIKLYDDGRFDIFKVEYT